MKDIFNDSEGQPLLSFFLQLIFQMFQSSFSQSEPRSTTFRSSFSLTSPSFERTARGAVTKWFPNLAQPGDHDTFKEKFAIYGPKTKQRDRIRQKFLRFKELNPTESPISAVEKLIGQWLNSGLRPSTCETYLKYLQPLIIKETREREKISEIRRCIEAMHADSDTRIAPQLSSDSLTRILSLTKGRLQAFLWIMYQTGLRSKAISVLRRKQIKYCAQQGLRIQIWLDKNHRHRHLRVTLSIPPMLLSPITKTTKTIIEEGLPDERPFQNFTANHVNNNLRRLCQRHGITSPTTYSWRRAYMNRVKSFCKGDAQEMKKYTLHLSNSITEAHYIDF